MKLSGEPESVSVRQDDVNENQIRLEAPDRLPGLGHGFGLLDQETLIDEIPRDDRAGDGIVLDDNEPLTRCRIHQF